MGEVIHTHLLQPLKTVERQAWNQVHNSIFLSFNSTAILHDE